MNYAVGILRLENMSVNLRHQNDSGEIVIGGDKGDVYADFAEEDGDSVLLSGVILKSSLELTDDEARDAAMEIIQFSYDSIQSDTFIPQR